MEHEWWYADAGQKVGPVQLLELLQRLASDQIRLETLVWQPGWKDWRKLMDVEEIRTQVLDVLREQRHRNPPPLPPNATEALDSSPNRSSSAMAGIPSSAPAERSVSQVRPWIRFWARYFDYNLAGLALGLILGLVIPNLVDNRLLAAVAPPAVWMLIETWTLSSWGTTPGKYLLGVSITDRTGGVPSLDVAFKRSLLVWVRGMALGIPLIALFTSALWHQRLLKRGIARWDEDLHLMVHHNPITATKAGTLIVILVLILGLAVYSYGGGG